MGLFDRYNVKLLYDGNEFIFKDEPNNNVIKIPENELKNALVAIDAKVKSWAMQDPVSVFKEVGTKGILIRVNQAKFGDYAGSLDTTSKPLNYVVYLFHSKTQNEFYLTDKKGNCTKNMSLRNMYNSLVSIGYKLSPEKFREVALKAARKFVPEKIVVNKVGFFELINGSRK